MDEKDKKEILGAINGLASQANERIDTNKKELLGAIASLSAHTEERISELTKEMRAGFESVDRRLVSLEDKVEGIEKSLDEILEGDVLGKNHITLTRPEYDTMVDSLHLPNRFEGAL